MPSTPAITPALVRALADFAALPLEPGREAAVASVLAAWVPEAAALSDKMSAPEHRATVPVTVFSHPQHDEAE